MDPAKRAELDKKLAQLREFYLQSLPAEFEKLDGMLKQLSTETSAREIVSDIHAALHKFAGSGGSFGLHGLSLDARRIEQELLVWLKSDQVLMPQKDIDHLNHNIIELKKVLGKNRLESTAQGEDNASASGLTVTQIHNKVHGAKVKKICLVESNQILFNKLKTELGSFNFDVSAFESLSAINKEKKETKADLLIIDFDLLEFNQEANIYQLPGRLSAHNPPVIVIGVQDDFKTRLAVAKFGARGYFVSPFDISDVIKCATQIFEKQSAKPGRVMIVDDDLQLAAHYKLVLESAGFSVDSVIQPDELILRVDSFKPELILLDLNMPNISGRDLAGVIRQYKRYASLPIVFLSAETKLSTQLDALYHGADEFLTKPISDQSLILAVHSRIERARTLDALIKKDGLTGLLTHSNIKDMADYELKRARRTRSTHCFAMLDIDHFKKVNDTYGHAVGDQVIASLATFLKQRLRSTDLIGRYGGEEFLVVLPECSLEEAYALLDKIRVLFKNIQFDAQDRTFNCSISIGIASTSQLLSSSADELINSADTALYQAKNNGRNKTVLFSASI